MSVGGESALTATASSSLESRYTESTTALQLRLEYCPPEHLAHVSNSCQDAASPPQQMEASESLPSNAMHDSVFLNISRSCYGHSFRMGLAVRHFSHTLARVAHGIETSDV